jgi:ribosomal protein S18 acetylase RimI-like enzyme
MSIDDSRSGPIVRRATPADLPRIGSLGALLVAEHHAFDSRRFFAAGPRMASEYASFLSTQLEGPKSAVLVAEDGGQVIGYSWITVEGYDYKALRGPAGVLQDVIVDPSHRGRGVGRQLLNAALAYLQSRGVAQVVLSTAERNLAAQKLFASAGFRPTMIEMTTELEEDPAG